LKKQKIYLKSTNDCINTNFQSKSQRGKLQVLSLQTGLFFFHKKLETDSSFNDVIGEIKDVKKFQNGNVSLFLQNGNQKFNQLKILL
jgi:hypothetical protein